MKKLINYLLQGILYIAPLGITAYIIYAVFMFMDGLSQKLIANFFDVKIDNDNILTFTPDRVAQEILGDTREFVKYVGRRGGWLTNNVRTNGAIFARLGFTPATEEVFHPNNNLIGEVISEVTSEKTHKTWCYVKFPTGEGVYNREKLRTIVDDKQKIVFTKSRQEIRIGRAVRLLLTAYNFNPTAAATGFRSS